MSYRRKGTPTFKLCRPIILAKSSTNLVLRYVAPLRGKLKFRYLPVAEGNPIGLLMPTLVPRCMEYGKGDVKEFVFSSKIAR